MARLKLCKWCGKPLPMHMSQRMRHPECARLHEQSRIAAVYAAKHGGQLRTCRRCGRAFHSTGRHRHFCQECNRKPFF